MPIPPTDSIKGMSFLIAFAILLSTLQLVQSLYSSYLRIYAWNQDRSAQYGAPRRLIKPEKSFTVLLPARHEEDVIAHTIEGIARANYPQKLLEIVVICRQDDTGTIQVTRNTIAELKAKGHHNISLIIFSDFPINKPHGCNVALRCTSNEVVTLFDAEDQVHPDIFNVVNTIMVKEDYRVVQAGVQLMNFDTTWFSVHNVLEYFFWFKSTLYYYAEMGLIPLGGNTVFFDRSLLEQLGGWDETCLTEDADIGIRLSVLNERVRVVYEDIYVTKEETPPDVVQFIRQRSRWNQGFLQILKRGHYFALPRLQRLVALYTLSFPLLQAITLAYIPLSIYTIFFVKVSSPIALYLCIPAYVLLGHVILSLLALYEFSKAHRLRVGPFDYLSLILTYLPYQVLLGIGAFRGAWREISGNQTWEKTRHVNAHRHRRRQTGVRRSSP
jgi:cellulose synthase/poly-beta-1,6-N-acetylglucosamine synthase-like glycosyltransferase